VKFIADHQGESVSRLLSASKGNLEFVGLVRAAVRPLQLTEDLIAAMWDGLHLDQAVGKQLDLEGKHFKEQRGGRTDEVYRAALGGKWGEYQQSGEPEVLIPIFKGLIGAYRVRWIDWEVHRSPVVEMIAYLTVNQKTTETLSGICRTVKKSAQNGGDMRLAFFTDQTLDLFVPHELSFFEEVFFCFLFAFIGEATGPKNEFVFEGESLELPQFQFLSNESLPVGWDDSYRQLSFYLKP